MCVLAFRHLQCIQNELNVEICIKLNIIIALNDRRFPQGGVVAWRVARALTTSHPSSIQLGDFDNTSHIEFNGRIK
jgi:hypothetical protein